MHAHFYKDHIYNNYHSQTGQRRKLFKHFSRCCCGCFYCGNSGNRWLWSNHRRRCEKHWKFTFTNLTEIINNFHYEWHFSVTNQKKKQHTLSGSLATQTARRVVVVAAHFKQIRALFTSYGNNFRICYERIVRSNFFFPPMLVRQSIFKAGS